MYGPANATDAYKRDTKRNKAAAEALRDLVKKLQDQRAALMKEAGAGKPQDAQGRLKEPIYILAYSNGANVAALAAELGMEVDGVGFVGAALHENYDLKHLSKNAKFLQNWHSFADTDADWGTMQRGIGKRGVSKENLKKYKNIDQDLLANVKHYIDDDFKTSKSRERVNGRTGWISNHMGYYYYGATLHSAGDLLSAKWNADKGGQTSQYDSGVK